MKTVENAYQEISRGIIDFIKDRAWDMGFCHFEIYKNMASSTCWLINKDIKNTDGIDWPDKNIDKGGAALFIRDDLLKTTGDRIWGLTFTLFPTGNFKIEYNYDKPEGYVED